MQMWHRNVLSHFCQKNVFCNEPFFPVFLKILKHCFWQLHPSISLGVRSLSQSFYSVFKFQTFFNLINFEKFVNSIFRLASALISNFLIMCLPLSSTLRCHAVSSQLFWLRSRFVKIDHLLPQKQKVVGDILCGLFTRTSGFMHKHCHF